MMQVDFEMPKGMSEEFVARTFSAYLLGASAFLPHQEQSLGPCKAETKWQLDGSNDYWMRVEDRRVALSCRYPAQAEILEAMKSLFLLRNVPRNR